MPRYKVSIQHLDCYESRLIDADNEFEAAEKYREMVDFKSVEIINCAYINERIEEVDD